MTRLRVVCAVLVGILVLSSVVSMVSFTGGNLAIREAGSALALTDRPISSSAPAKAATSLSYQLLVDDPAGGVGASKQVLPAAGDLVNFTLKFDSIHDRVSVSVKDTKNHESTTLGYKVKVPFKPPEPGTYLMGVGSGTGTNYANWTAKDIYLFDASGETIILSSKPNPVSHVPMYVEGSATPLFNSRTGALELLPEPSAFVYGLAVFPYDYTGGNLTMTVLANYTQDNGFPSDGLEEYLFMNTTLVSPTTSGGLESGLASTGFLPVSSGVYDYSLQGDVGFPDSSNAYFAVEWDPAWAEHGSSTPEFNIWVPYSSGTFVSGFTANPSAISEGNQTTLVVNVSHAAKRLTFDYTMLPPGCTSSNTSSLECIPTATGTYTIAVNVTGGVGTWNIANTTLAVALG